MSQPIGMKTKPSRRTGLAAVLTKGVAAGTIASSNGSARVRPMPRRNVRRGMAVFVMIINAPFQFSHALFIRKSFVLLRQPQAVREVDTRRNVSNLSLQPGPQVLTQSRPRHLPGVDRLFV